ncbi:fatty acid desaturase family protein [Aurantibacillus circumpalustris]|uniref:fatty acid desaturase family protein n=1 Tax=Aurantibacillus circumpalustris TaxID=3036359 RepID=UPI00295AD000|nr:acyl-CoA desaturase [Aurantibacillus circumpalustris]
MTSEGMKKYPRFVAVDKTVFFPTLQKRVSDYFKENNISRNANAAMVIKTIVLLSGFVVPLILMIVLHLKPWAVLTLYTVMGFAKAGIGMSVMHDANHGAYSKNKQVNTWLGYSLNLIGGMVFNWKLQHNVLHHTYTNIHGMDDDIEEKLVLRFSPHSAPRKFHKFQFLYVFFFYGILTFYWVLAKDIIQYYKYRKNGVNRFSTSENRSYFWRMIFLKLFYIAYVIILPIVFQDYSIGLIIGGFLLSHFIGGLVLGIVFQLAHSVQEAEFPLPNESNVIEEDWAVHQMKTTVNFARENKLLSWYVGGLNYQVEHHLFPNICHVHYPEISKIVEETAKEFNVPYLCADTLKKALGSHLRMLKKFGYTFELDVAAM